MSKKSLGVKYIHLRKTTAKGVSSMGGVTVAVDKFTDGTGRATIARCRDDERFIKSYGRTIAFARLNDPEHSNMCIDLGNVDEFYSSVYQNGIDPARWPREFTSKPS